MKTVTIHEAKTHLSRLVREVVEGNEVIIARGKTPLVKLVALTSAKPRRQLGTAKGLIEMSEDFDAPLEDFDAYS